jgi:cephalosporin hydroxylase
MPQREILLVARYMEDSLNLPLADVLSHLQQRILQRSEYFGIRTLKSPIDFWVYQEILFRSKPDVVIEIGNYLGGSTLALAHLLDSIGSGRVIGIDIDQRHIPDLVREHPRVLLLEGDACDRFPDVQDLLQPGERAVVIEDSSHTYDNTLAVLRTYSGLVAPGDYLIVEDSICNHGLDVGPSPGPYEAIDAFVAEDGGFETDRDMESFLITWNPKGYLRRKASNT